MPNFTFIGNDALVQVAFHVPYIALVSITRGAIEAGWWLNIAGINSSSRLTSGTAS